MNCVGGAAVVARHAVGAVAVPMRAAVDERYVAERAVLLADAAAYAVVVDYKALVGYQKLVEQCVHYARLDSGQDAAFHVEQAVAV